MSDKFIMTFWGEKKFDLHSPKVVSLGCHLLGETIKIYLVTFVVFSKFLCHMTLKICLHLALSCSSLSGPL